MFLAARDHQDLVGPASEPGWRPKVRDIQDHSPERFGLQSSDIGHQALIVLLGDGQHSSREADQGPELAQGKGERRQTRFARMGYLYGGADLQQPATFWKRDLYLKCGGMDQSYLFAFDTDLFTRFAIRRARFKHVNKFVASFRIHPASKSSNQLEICERELQRLRQDHLPFPFQSIRARWARTVARVQRTLWYALQGDLLWLLGRIPDRIRARNAIEIAGPRARRM